MACQVVPPSLDLTSCVGEPPSGSYSFPITPNPDPALGNDTSTRAFAGTAESPRQGGCTLAAVIADFGGIAGRGNNERGGALAKEMISPMARPTATGRYPSFDTSKEAKQTRRTHTFTCQTANRLSRERTLAREPS